MKGLIDRLFLLVISGIAVCFSDNSTISMVISVLALMIFFSLGVFFEDRKDQYLIEIIIGLGIVFYEGVIPAFLFLIYEGFVDIFRGKYKSAIIMAATLLIQVVLCFFGRRIINSPVVGVILIFAGILAIYLAYNTVKINSLKKEKVQLRDDNEEVIRLERTRQALTIKNQDAEIIMATLKERNRIAREIHDNVGHLLSRCILQLGAISTVHKNEPIAEELKLVQEGLNESMNSIRSSVHNLHNESLDLEKSINKLIESNSNFVTSFEYDVENEIPMKIKYCLISVITECYQNANKHSNGNAVEIIIREHPGLYQLVFWDNGTNAQIKENGIGLHNMEERVRELLGTVSFSAESGFRIFVSIPKEVEK